MKSRIATIKDVAKAAGVSISTVSAVINRNKPVSEDLVLRVGEAIAQLDYYPNHMARTLNRSQTKTLAYLTPDISNAGFLRIFKTVIAVARSRGYTVLLVNTDGSVDLAKEALRRTIEMRVDGILLTLSSGLVHTDLNLGTLAARGIQAVGVAGSWPVGDFDCFLWNERGAGNQLGRYLRRLDHTHLLCIGPAKSRTAELRWEGLRSAYADDTRPYRITAIDSHDYTAKGGYDAMLGAVASEAEFTSIVAFNDAIATGVLAALSDQGIAIPDDVSFASFGGIHNDYARPQITSMLFDEDILATAATTRLLDRIEGRFTAQARSQYFDLTLSLRGSSRKTSRDGR